MLLPCDALLVDERNYLVHAVDNLLIFPTELVVGHETGVLFGLRFLVDRVHDHILMELLLAHLLLRTLHSQALKASLDDRAVSQGHVVNKSDL